MRCRDLLRISLRQIFRHRHRYLGVVVVISLGAAGLIIMGTMGRDFKRNLNQDLDLIGGVTVMRVFFDQHLTPWPQAFQPDSVAALRRLPGVRDVSLVASRGARTSLPGGRTCYFTVVAVDEHFWKVRSFWPGSGSLFGREAIAEHRLECVLGASLAERIFGRKDVMGQTLSIYKEVFQVTGVLGGITDLTLAECAFLPLTTVQDRFPEVTIPDRLYLRCDSVDDVARVAALVPQVVQDHQDAAYLRVHVPWEGLTRVQRVFWWAEVFIYLSLGGSLLVGGAGIWNIMMAAVRTRTREIGLKKAMGAEDGDVLAEFLTEALLLSLTAFVLGMLLALVVIAVLGRFLDSRLPQGVLLWWLGSGLLFALLLGLGAGFYPALQASRMEVVDAVRFE